MKKTTVTVVEEFDQNDNLLRRTTTTITEEPDAPKPFWPKFTFGDFPMGPAMTNSVSTEALE